MASIFQLAALAMIAVDAVIGVRLLLLAWRTRLLPETALGVAFLLLGAIGYPLTTAARREVLPTDEANQALMAFGYLAQNAACFAIYVMTAHTFYRTARGMRLLLVVVGATLAASWVGQGLQTGFETYRMGGAYYVGLAARTGGFAWVCHASLREYWLARKRVRIGLLHPLIANRFLLFGFGTGGVFVAFVIFFLGQLTTENVAEAGWVLAATGCAGLLAAVPTWLAFLPPRAYRRLFEPAAESASGA